MVTGDSEDDEIVISESLAEDNDLEVGDEVSFYLPEDEDATYTFIIVGIFEAEDDDTSSSFMNMNVLNSSNQMYANVHSVEDILEDMEDDDSKLVQNNGLSASFCLTDNDLVDEFEEEVRSKGLSDYYTVSTNEEEILAALEPVQNIVSFSVQFLVVILIIGIVVLSEEVRGNSNDAPSQGGEKPKARDDRNPSQTVTDYVDSLTVHISPMTIIELFGISILLIIGSSVVARLFVNKYNPNAILQNRN